MSTQHATAEQLQHDWNTNPRWQGITRPYRAAEVVRLRGTVPLGFTVLKPNSEAWGGDAYLGFNTGLLGGIEISFGNFGVFTDIGVRFHRVYANNDIPLEGRTDASLSWAQLSLNTGIQLAF